MWLQSIFQLPSGLGIYMHVFITVTRYFFWTSTIYLRITPAYVRNMLASYEASSTANLPTRHPTSFTGWYDLVPLTHLKLITDGNIGVGVDRILRMALGMTTQLRRGAMTLDGRAIVQSRH